MAFAKLDDGILDSTLWLDRDQRDIFITALLLAEPCDFDEPLEQLDVGTMKLTGFVAPPGWYGFVRAAGPGIVHRAIVDQKSGMEALRKLGEPEAESRSADFEGRRLIRINGGYAVLNFMKYRDKDHTAAERMRRFRERKKGGVVTRDVTDETRNVTSPIRNVTQAECREQSAECIPQAFVTEEEKSPPRSGEGNGRARGIDPSPFPKYDPEQDPPSPAAYPFSDLKDDATMVARAVTEHFKFSSQWDYEGIRCGAELQLRENVPKDELKESMIAAWDAYTQRIKEGKHRTGIRRKPQDFFGDGTWANWRLWGLKKGFKGYEKTDKENATQCN